MIERLPRRVRPVDGEPADSLLHRLGTCWGMSRDEFARFVGFDNSQMRQGRHVEALAAMAGADVRKLSAVSPRRERGSRRVVVGGAWTDLSELAGRRLRVCPLCFDEDRHRARAISESRHLAAWCRPEWSVGSVATCVRHAVMLVGSCQACGKPLDGRNPAVDLCTCGMRVETAGASQISKTDALLVGMIHGDDATAWTAGAGLHQLSAHLTRLGALVCGWSQRRPEVAGPALLERRDAGLALSNGGPEALRAVLDRIAEDARPGGCGRLGVTSAYGWVWPSWLGVPTANPLDLRLRDALVLHATERGFRTGRRPGDVTLAEAGAMLGSGHGRTRRLVAGAGLMDGAELPGVGMALDGAGVADVASALAGLLDATNAAAVLGITRQRFREVARARLVGADAGAAAIGAGSLYTLDVLRSLVDRVAGTAPLLDRPPVGCRPVPRACRDASVPLTRLLAALQSGRLHAVARTSGGGLGSVWVSVREVRSLARPALSIRSAARNLGVHYEAARWLAAEGHLGVVPGAVDESSVASFRAAFVTSGQAGREMGASPCTAVGRMRSAGYSPEFGPPACRQAIWRRDALSAAKRTL